MSFWGSTGLDPPYRDGPKAHRMGGLLHSSWTTCLKNPGLRSFSNFWHSLGLESQSKCPRVSWETKVPSNWEARSPRVAQAQNPRKGALGSHGRWPSVWEPLWWQTTFPNRPQGHPDLKCEVKGLQESMPTFPSCPWDMGVRTKGPKPGWGEMQAKEFNVKAQENSPLIT